MPPASSACMTEPEVGHVNSSFSPVLLSRKLDVIKPEASTQVSCILPESRSHSFTEPRIAAVVFFFFSQERRAVASCLPLLSLIAAFLSLSLPPSTRKSASPPGFSSTPARSLLLYSHDASASVISAAAVVSAGALECGGHAELQQDSSG